MANDQIRPEIHRAKKVLEVLEKVLGPFVEKTTGKDRLPAKPSPGGRQNPTIEQFKHNIAKHDEELRSKPFDAWGAPDLLHLISVVWSKEFADVDPSAKEYVYKLKHFRNTSEHHPKSFTVVEANQMLEAAIDLLIAIGAKTEADTLDQMKRLRSAPSSETLPPTAPSFEPSPPPPAPSSEPSSRLRNNVGDVFRAMLLGGGLVALGTLLGALLDTGKNAGGPNVGTPLQSHQDRNLAPMEEEPEETNVSRVLHEERIRAIKDKTLGDDLDRPERLLPTPLSEPPLR